MGSSCQMTSLLLFPAGDAFRAVLVEEMVGCQKGQFDLVAMRQRIAAVLRLQPLAGKLIEALSVPAKVSITIVVPDGQNDLLNHPGEECFQALVALLIFLELCPKALLCRKSHGARMSTR